MPTKEDLLRDLYGVPGMIQRTTGDITSYFGQGRKRSSVDQLSRPDYGGGELDQFLAQGEDPGFIPDPDDRMRYLGMTPEQGGAPPAMAEPAPDIPEYGIGHHRPAQAQEPPAPEGGGPDYRQYLTGYLEELGRPVQMPQARPFTKMQAISMALNPERRAELERSYRAPYEREVAEWKIEQQRRGEAARIAGTLHEADVRQQEREGAEKTRLSERDYQRDLIHANAGDLAHDYSSNPELGTLAQRRRQMGRESRQPRPKQPKSKTEFLAGLEDDMRARAGQVISGRGGVGAALSMFMPEQFESFNDILGDSEAEYRYMQAMRETVRGLSEGEFMTFMYRMSPQQQLEAMYLLAGYQHPVRR